MKQIDTLLLPRSLVMNWKFAVQEAHRLHEVMPTNWSAFSRRFSNGTSEITLKLREDEIFRLQSFRYIPVGDFQKPIFLEESLLPEATGREDMLRRLLDRSVILLEEHMKNFPIDADIVSAMDQAEMYIEMDVPVQRMSLLRVTDRRLS